MNHHFFCNLTLGPKVKDEQEASHRCFLLRGHSLNIFNNQHCQRGNTYEGARQEQTNNKVVPNLPLPSDECRHVISKPGVLFPRAAGSGGREL